ncbi:MAG: DUF1385 domain-containing protein [Clostridia bacterium]|nr:DUF1385 domain-containing protein [Clostridia bacterium]
MNKKTTIGGQALLEGILMRGPENTRIVVRKPDKELEIKDDPIGTDKKNPIAKIPFIRGVVNFWDSMKYGMSALNYSASFFDEEEEELSKAEKWLNNKLGKEKFDKLLLTVATVIGVAMPVVLFIFLPTILAGFFESIESNLLRNLVEGLLRVTLFLAFVIITSKQSDVRRTYMYHGAEHKTIYCYEKGLPLTVDNVRKQSCHHPRCGTSFMFVVMIISILVFSFFKWTNPVVRVLMRLALLPVVVGISYEFNRFVGRHDNWFTNLLRAPGMFLQNFTTVEPDDSMIEVAIAAIEGVIPENKEKDNW